MDVGCSQSLKQLPSSSTDLIKDTLSPVRLKKTRLCFIEILEMVYVFLNYLFFAVFIYSEAINSPGKPVTIRLSIDKRFVSAALSFNSGIWPAWNTWLGCHVQSHRSFI